MAVINRWSDCIDAPENSPIYAGNPSDEVWTTQDGRPLKVGEMTEAHVINCYNMVVKTHSVCWQKIFKAELEKRGRVVMETI